MPNTTRAALRPYLHPKRHKWYARGTYPIKNATGNITAKRGFLGAGCDTKTACQIECDRLNRELEAEAQAGAPESIFEDAVLTYLQLGGEGRFLHDRLLDQIGQLRVNAIDDAIMTAAAAAVYPNCTPGTINRQLYTPVIRVLKLAAKSKAWKPDLQRPKGYAKLQPARPPDDAWFGAVQPECSPQLWALLLFDAAHGRRGGDAVRCSPADFDPSAGTVLIPKTKNGDPLLVRLAPEVAEALFAYNWQAGPGLFGSYYLKVRRNPNSTSCRQLFRDLKAACERAGITYFTPHKAGRHVFAKRGLDAGWSLKKLKEAGRWKTIRVPAEIYGHMEHSEVDDSARELSSGWIKNLGKSKNNVVPIKKAR